MSRRSSTENDNALDALELAQDLAFTVKLQAEGEQIGWQAKREELAYTAEKLALDWQLDGNYTFHSGVDRESVDELLHIISLWHQHDPAGDWTITINSPGGEVYAGMLLVDELRAHSLRCGGSHRVEIRVRGMAASMGGVILQAADHRVIGRYSEIMIHKGGIGFGADTYLSVDEWADEAELAKQWVERMIDLFLERTDKLTRAQIKRRISRRDWWISANEALKLGLVDRIG